jgi:hypothetical protein
VSIAHPGACLFNDNRCLLRSDKTPLVVEIVAGAAVISSNYVEGPADRQAAAMRVNLPNFGPFTVLGNIASGPIEVNGNSMNAMSQAGPWPQLNVQAV